MRKSKCTEMEQCNVTFNQAGSVTLKTFKDVFLYGCRGHASAKLHKAYMYTEGFS